ncbi:MAG TPA: carbonic anhydrase [Syntrophorhabdaceae bacterium]|nr:carbonic anhydrase [Syntrophorhabdaceae bacterium]MDI9561716.1 carbonic anhydrase [Pseudomonadota bacterium]OQC47572.1 MAG: Carbonic anhydrase 2 [Deltaproteobacteria bacterium ADurb.Bin026]MBP8698227.1 carbonic anhydrase [Syntrophorhabdaceae bacterium]MBV6505683.1 Carbonic anhydrase 2 [Syntrophorhabdaceae bacterium]
MSNKNEIEGALKRLIDGNNRYVSSKMAHPNQTENRRKEVIKGQKPFAVIVGCSDSRIPPEIIFDQGIGDLFVIRVAGNIVDDVALGSVEYAVDHLGTKLVIVLGHGNCGAVTATVQGGEAHGHIGSIVRTIAPAVEKARAQTGDLIDNAIKINVALVVDEIKSSSIIKKMLEQDSVRVAGAYYDIDSGKVDIIA